LIAAELRLTAHPAGPHHLAGPSSEIGTPSVEYRGSTGGLPLRLVDGVLRETLLVAQDIPGMARLTGEEATAAGSRTSAVTQMAGAIASDRNASAATPASAARVPKPRTVAECIETAGVRVTPTPDGHVVSACFPLPDGAMFVSTARVEGSRRYPVPEVDKGIVEAATPDDFDPGEDMHPGPGGILPHFGDTLVRCGLHVPRNGYRALLPWLKELAASGAAPDLDTLGGIWSARVEAAGVPALRERIDNEAIDLLSLSSLDILDDAHAYRHTRDVLGNAGGRAVLQAFPMLFGEIWCSPEAAPTPLPELRRTLVTDGLSCGVMDYGKVTRLPPLPEWLVGWLEGRTWHHGGVADPMEVYAALVILSRLGPEHAPATEADWAALVEIAGSFTSLFREGEEFTSGLDAAAWRALLGEAGKDWRDYADSLRRFVPEGQSIYRTIRAVAWDGLREETGADSDDGLHPSEVDRFTVAFTARTLADRMAHQAEE
jgi:hypothetical protein